MKIVIVYRVIQEWRAPVFSKLAKVPDVSLEVVYGCDFPETKVVSTKKKLDFVHKRLLSFPVKLPTGKNKALVPFSPFLFFHLIKSKPDVVICEGASNFLNNIFVFLYCLLFRIPMVQWGLGEIRNTKKSKLRALLDILIIPIEKKSTAVISYSSIGKGYYKSIGLKDEQVFVAVNVVDTELRQQQIVNTPESAIVRKNGFNVLFVGALEESKKIEELIYGFSFLQIKYPNCHLTIVGEGSHRSILENLVKQLKLRNVDFVGKVFDGVSRYFLGADVFVLPGLGGLAISDALSHGLPVICTVGDGCEVDLVQNGINGFLDDNLNSNSIANYLERLLLDPQELKKMKDCAGQSLQKYNITNYVSQICSAASYAVTVKRGVKIC